MKNILLKSATLCLLLLLSITSFAQHKDTWEMQLKNNNQGKVQQLTPEQARDIIEGKKKPTSVYKEKPQKKPNTSTNMFENQSSKPQPAQDSLFESKDDSFKDEEKPLSSKNVKPEIKEKTGFGEQPTNAIDAIKGDRKVSSKTHEFSKTRRFSNKNNSVTFTPN